MDGYQLRTMKKKEKIKKVALDLFMNFGIEKVSLAEIAKKANVSPVTIYNYFGTKDELVKNVVASFFQEEWESRINMTKRRDLSFPQKIEELIFATSDISGRVDPDFFNKAINGYPDLKKIIDDISAKNIPYFLEFIEEGKRTGYIDPDVSTDSIFVYLDILQKASNNFKFDEDKVKNSKLANDLAKLFFYGLLKKLN